MCNSSVIASGNAIQVIPAVDTRSSNEIRQKIQEIILIILIVAHKELWAIYHVGKADMMIWYCTTRD
jgi:hypothetical protein